MAAIKISVALCTYNGARFLAEQLKSLSAQTRQPDELVVCDDGSCDKTMEILEQFSKVASFPVRLTRNDSNLGVVANFRYAISLCCGEFTALSDQDDVWLPEKLKQAEDALMKCETPETALYCSRLQYVDANLNVLGLSGVPDDTGFFNAVVENTATGCTVVFGTEIKRRFLQADPGAMIMHDWWLYLLASTFGKVLYDPRPSVLYRQHGNNVSEWKPRPSKIWNRICSLGRRLQAGREGMDSLNQARRLLDTYNDIPYEKRRIIDELVSLRSAGFFKRLNYLMSVKVCRNDIVENAGLKFIILMGWH